MVVCPTERLVDKMLFAYKEKADAVDLRYPEKLQLITTLRINQEPILLQVTFQFVDIMSIAIIFQIQNIQTFQISL